MFADEADIWVGRQYGPYSITELLGRGTVANVYRASLRDGNEVALKVLTPFAEARQEIRSLFEQEFELMVRLDHPNVVKASQSGVIAGTHYMEIEPIEGETLLDRVESNKSLELEEIAAALRRWRRTRRSTARSLPAPPSTATRMHMERRPTATSARPARRRRMRSRNAQNATGPSAPPAGSSSRRRRDYAIHYG